MNPEEEINQLEELLNELLSGIQQVIQTGEILTDEFQGMLAQEIDYLTSRIDQLREQIQPLPETPQAQPELHQAMPSSNIESFGYDDKTGRLLVRFLGDFPNRNGPVYGYEGVPKQIFELFRQGAIPARTDGKNKWGKWWKGKVPSAGASLYTLIKNVGYQYQRLS